MRRRKKVEKLDYVVFLTATSDHEVEEVFVRQASCVDEARAVAALTMLGENDAGTWHIIDAIPYKTRVT